MKKFIIILGILFFLIFATIGIVKLMFNIYPIGVSESEIQRDCESAILAAQYNNNTIQSFEDLKTIIIYIDSNLDSILDYRKSVNINLSALNDKSLRKLKAKYNHLYDVLQKNNLESININSNGTIELTQYAVVRPTKSYNYEIKHSVIKGDNPQQKMNDTSISTLQKFRWLNKNEGIYYSIQVSPRYGW
jgi:hypothetical protein